MVDVEERMTGYHCKAIVQCIKTLLDHDLDAVEDGKIHLKVDKFWDEHKAFQKK